MSESKKALTSAEVRAKHKEFLFPSVANYYEEPVVLESGKGSRLKDLDGKNYLDFFGGILTVSLGQAHERVNKALEHSPSKRSGPDKNHPTSGDITLLYGRIAPTVHPYWNRGPF